MDKAQVNTAEYPSELSSLILGKPIKRNHTAEYIQWTRKPDVV